MCMQIIVGFGILLGMDVEGSKGFFMLTCSLGGIPDSASYLLGKGAVVFRWCGSPS